jgi:E3 ubiquitin-protein ligase HERC1
VNEHEFRDAALNELATESKKTALMCIKHFNQRL